MILTHCSGAGVEEANHLQNAFHKLMYQGKLSQVG